MVPGFPGNHLRHLLLPTQKVLLPPLHQGLLYPNTGHGLSAWINCHTSISNCKFSNENLNSSWFIKLRHFRAAIEKRFSESKIIILLQRCNPTNDLLDHVGLFQMWHFNNFSHFSQLLSVWWGETSVSYIINLLLGVKSKKLNC